jgi:hypothetical protein
MSGWEIAPVMPTEGSTTPVESGGTFNLAQYAVGLRNFALGVTGAGILIALMIAWVPELRPFRALVLEAAAGGTAADAPAQRDASKARIGDTGITRSALRPYGSVEIGGMLGVLQHAVPTVVQDTDNSGEAQRGFCGRCGSSLFWKRDGQAVTSICAGSIDGPTGLRIAGHIFVADKGDYYSIGDPAGPDEYRKDAY